MQGQAAPGRRGKELAPLIRTILQAVALAMGVAVAVLAALGEHVAAAYIEGKEREWDEYRTSVSDWEDGKYITQY